MGYKLKTSDNLEKAPGESHKLSDHEGLKGIHHGNFKWVITVTTNNFKKEWPIDSMGRDYLINHA